MRDSIDITFGQSIRLRRGELGLTQRALGVAVGVSQEWVSKVETGATRSPRAVTLIRLASVLHVDPSDLLAAFGSESEQPPAPAPRDIDGERLRGKVAEWLRLTARSDPRWSEHHATLLDQLANEAERSTLLARLLAGDEQLPEPPPKDNAPHG